MSYSSYSKTTVIGLGATAVSAGATALFLAVPGAPISVALAILSGAVMLASSALVASGWLVIRRERRAQRGEPDLFLESNRDRSEAALSGPDAFVAGGVRRLLARATLGHDFLVGDVVEIRSLDEIRATLDDEGCLDGIPFQAEMARFCGSTGRVFRSIDKIYDYGRTRVIRRLDGCVLLTGLRCDGSDHGDCQARCYLIWNVAWLRRPGHAPTPVPASPAGRIARPMGVEKLPDGSERPRWICQYTQLHAASRPMGALNIGKELRPLIAGNVTLRTWLIGLATRYFNLVQARRGGTAFPAMAPLGGSTAPEASESLRVGDTVVVKSNAAIASTLNAKNKHRGLWFDRDQLKYCGSQRKVLARVERIIDDVHGQMLPMKTPCILLEGVDYSGESLSFSAQHDLFFWREAWLQKQPASADRSAPAGSAEAS